MRGKSLQEVVKDAARDQARSDKAVGNEIMLVGAKGLNEAGSKPRTRSQEPGPHPQPRAVPWGQAKAHWG